MLEDPDALMADPEIKRIIAEGAGATALEVVEGQYPEGGGAAAAAGGAAAAAAAAAAAGEPGAAAAETTKAEGGRQKGSSKGADKEKEEVVVEKEATDEDPREHLNIVFIGHGAFATTGSCFSVFCVCYVFAGGAYLGKYGSFFSLPAWCLPTAAACCLPSACHDCSMRSTTMCQCRACRATMLAYYTTAQAVPIRLTSCRYGDAKHAGTKVEVVV